MRDDIKDDQGDGHPGLSVAGTALIADPSGALFWPDEAMLIVADLHLEKGSSFAERRVFLPPYDTFTTIRRLCGAVERLRPRVIVSLGDAFHDERASHRLPPRARDDLAEMMRGRTFIWVAGNHDPAPPSGLGGEVMAEVALGPLVLRHEPSGATGEVAGHLHPVARVRVKGGAIRRRCFVSDGNALILPAFGAYAGGLCVRDEAYSGLIREPFQAFLLGERRTYVFSSSHVVAEGAVRGGGTPMPPLLRRQPQGRR